MMNVSFTVKKTLELSPEADALLVRLAADLGIPAGQAILWGISILRAALNAKERGGRLALLDKDGSIEVEIDIPGGN
jgi:hypothetical protein